MNKELGQYYTHQNISKLLISKIFAKNPKKILELGVGDGSLFRAAKDRWKNSDLIGGDIDIRNVHSLKKEFPDTNIYFINGLSSNLRSDLKIEFGSVDVGICNPPYIAIKKSEDLGKILEQSNLGFLHEYSQVTSDLIFLAQNLLLLKDGGELGIIIPDGLITSHFFENFRRNLIQNYQLKGVIELPSKIFPKTEAKTHILIIKKGKITNYQVPIYLSNDVGEITSKIFVKKKDLIIRMDYKYNYWKRSCTGNGKTLSELGAVIFRGKPSKKELVQSGNLFLHTSDLQRPFQRMKFHSNSLFENLPFAQAGDIVIPRVGKRLEKVSIITSGKVVISDCVYVIRVEKKYRQAVINSLVSCNGKEWINAHAHGVCAKVISKIDLLNFRLMVDSDASHS